MALERPICNLSTPDRNKQKAAQASSASSISTQPTTLGGMCPTLISYVTEKLETLKHTKAS